MIVNNDVKAKMRTYEISQWMIADVIGVSENTINRWLRHQLPPQKRELLMNAIETCRQKKEKGVSE